MTSVLRECNQDTRGGRRPAGGGRRLPRRARRAVEAGHGPECGGGDRRRSRPLRPRPAISPASTPRSALASPRPRPDARASSTPLQPGAAPAPGTRPHLRPGARADDRRPRSPPGAATGSSPRRRLMPATLPRGASARRRSRRRRGTRPRRRGRPRDRRRHREGRGSSGKATAALGRPLVVRLVAMTVRLPVLEGLGSTTPPPPPARPQPPSRPRGRPGARPKHARPPVGVLRPVGVLAVTSS